MQKYQELIEFYSIEQLIEVLDRVRQKWENLGRVIKQFYSYIVDTVTDIQFKVMIYAELPSWNPCYHYDIQTQTQALNRFVIWKDKTCEWWS